MKDSRSEIGKGQIYNLEIKNLTGKELTCNIEGVTKYQDYLAYLVDERLNNEIKISEDMDIKIPPASHIIITNSLLVHNNSLKKIKEI